MSRMFQISEDDLAELERTLPQLSEALTLSLTNRLRTQLRRVRDIMSAVRWDYGPPGEVIVIPAGPASPPEGDDGTTGTKPP